MSVPVRTFKQLLDGIAMRLNLYDADTQTVNEDVAVELTELTTAAMRHAWTFYAWPDALEIREEDVIAHPDVTGAKYVPRQTDERTLSTVLGVLDADPRRQEARPSRVRHRVLSDGVYVYDASLAAVWVIYRPAAPEFSAVAWSIGTTYGVGDRRLATDGHVYRSLQAANTGNDPLTEAEWWAREAVLECLFEPVKQGVISHYKRHQSGQPVTAKTFDQLMQDALESEIQTIRDQEED